MRVCAKSCVGRSFQGEPVWAMPEAPRARRCGRHRSPPVRKAGARARVIHYCTYFMPPRRARSNGMSCRTLLVFAAGAALLIAWLRFASSMSQPIGGRVMTVAEFDRSVSGDGSVSTVMATVVPAADSSPQATIQRHHELHVKVASPAPLAPLLPPEKAVDAPAECRARAHTELEGGVVLWGTNNKVASAAACCESCRMNAAKAKPGVHACNVGSSALTRICVATDMGNAG